MLIKYSCLIRSIAAASSATWDYHANGADWFHINSDCGLPNQSPINLVSFGKEQYDYKTYNWTDDSLAKSYKNQFDTSIEMNGHTTQVNLNKDQGNHRFKSLLGGNVFGAPKDYEGV